MTRSGRRGGFTLLELSFAGGILAVSLGLLFGAIVHAGLLGDQTHAHMQALAALDQAMARVVFLSQTEIEAEPDAWHGLDGESEVSVTFENVDGVSPRLIEVQVTVTRTAARGREVSVSAATLIPGEASP